MTVTNFVLTHPFGYPGSFLEFVDALNSRITFKVYFIPYFLFGGVAISCGAFCILLCTWVVLLDINNK